MDFSEVVSLAPALSQGAHLLSETQTKFTVWAPDADRVAVEILTRTGITEKVLQTVALQQVADEMWSATIDDCPAGTLYRFQLNEGMGRPDPYSRFQPFGVHGPSQIINGNAYAWKHDDWQGLEKRNLIVYELHVGSFTDEGTYRAAIEKLPELMSLGITAIELLPVTQTPGRWNWGYDGVNFFAPRNTFGSPEDLKVFVDACHAAEIAVILDVVYNHVGPEGNYLSEYGPYRSPKHNTPWGDSLNFDGPDGEMVREFVIANVLFWLHEYHFDGLRLDAIHYMFDESEASIVHEIRERFRQYEKITERKQLLIAESNIYDAELLQNSAEVYSSYDAIWSDCLMHSIYSHGNPDVRLTNRAYVGSTDLAEALEHAYVFSAPAAIRVGQKERDLHHPAGDRNYISSLVMALQTHDSVGNHPHGKRLHQLTSLSFQTAAAPLILLYPCIPMIFMGEEWASDAPFPFFADFEDPALRIAVDKGRREEYPHHDWADSPLPSDPNAFLSTKMRPEQRHPEMWDWYQRLLQFRKRGLAEGWLDTKNMRTEYISSEDVFKLIYQTEDQKIVIVSRLAMPGAKEFELVFSHPVEIVMDSNFVGLEPAPAGESTTKIRLADRHCVIAIQQMDI